MVRMAGTGVYERWGIQRAGRRSNVLHKSSETILGSSCPTASVPQTVEKYTGTKHKVAATLNNYVGELFQFDYTELHGY